MGRENIFHRKLNSPYHENEQQFLLFPLYFALSLYLLGTNC